MPVFRQLERPGSPLTEIRSYTSSSHGDTLSLFLLGDNVTARYFPIFRFFEEHGLNKFFYTRHTCISRGTAKTSFFFFSKAYFQVGKDRKVSNTTLILCQNKLYNLESPGFAKEY